MMADQTFLRYPRAHSSQRRLAALLLIPLLLAFACSDGSSTGGSGNAVVIVQSDGQELRIATPPKRIVSLSAAATETFCALGAGESLVAVDKFANCPAAGKPRPEVDSFQPNLEAIRGFQPDLVYIFSNQGGIVEALRRLGVPVLYLQPPASIDGVFAEIEQLGRLTGREKEASSLAARLRQRRDAVAQKLASVTRGPRFFHELSSDYFTVRNDTFIGSLYVVLRGENIAAGAPTAYPQLSSEAIVARDPEVIVLTSGEKPAAVKQRPGWANLSAVRNDRICEVDGDLTSRPGPRIVEGLEALAKCLYPQRF